MSYDLEGLIHRLKFSNIYLKMRENRLEDFDATHCTRMEHYGTFFADKGLRRSQRALLAKYGTLIAWVDGWDRRDINKWDHFAQRMDDIVRQLNELRDSKTGDPEDIDPSQWI